MRRSNKLTLLALVVVGGLWAAWTTIGKRSFPPGIVDPAVEYYTSNHEAAYGGIDRWAYWGMPAGTALRILQEKGYACGAPMQPSLADNASANTYTILCTKGVRSLFPRILEIELVVDRERHDRLRAAKAKSTGLPFGLADFLGHIGILEPATLSVRGFERDSVDTLTAQVVDALRTGGWRTLCERETPYQCAADAHKRRDDGFPAIPAEPVPVGKASSLLVAMDRIALWPPEHRGADDNPDKSVMVRMESGHLWVDFIGWDLTGRQVSVAIELAPEGGRPVRLQACVGSECRSLALSGVPTRANDEQVMYLFPRAGRTPYRVALWIKPLDEEASIMVTSQFASEVARVDGEFIPQLLQIVVRSLTTSVRPDGRLGLYPVLTRVDRLAERLRATGLAALPSEDTAAWNDPVIRAAWALARCESAGRPPVIDEACWRAGPAADTDVVTLLSQEVARLNLVYQSLHASHPIRQRLRRLHDAITATPKETP